MLYININIKDINVYMHIQMLMSFSFQSYNSFPLVYVFMVHIVYLHGCTIILLTLDDPYLVNKWIILFYWFDMSKIRISKFLPHINIKPLLLFQVFLIPMNIPLPLYCGPPLSVSREEVRNVKSLQTDMEAGQKVIS